MHPGRLPLLPYLSTLLILCLILGSRGAAAATLARVHALVVGIGDYHFPDESGADLEFSVNDALAFAEFLQSPAGGAVQPRDLRLRTDSDATASTLAKDLNWVFKKSRDGDVVKIFFSGQAQLWGDEPVLLTGDSRPGSDSRPESTLSLGLLGQLAAKTRAQRVELYLDLARATPAPPARSPQHREKLMRSLQSLDQSLPALFLFVSTRHQQQSLEERSFGAADASPPWPGGGHGAFTFALLRAMSGEADANSDGAVNLAELCMFLPQAVSLLTGGAQEPYHSQNFPADALVGSRGEGWNPGLFDAIVPQPEPLPFSREERSALLKEYGQHMLWIPGGSFQMGTSDGEADEQPVHHVTLSGFWLGENELSQGLFQAVMGRNPSTPQDPAMPMNWVSWFDAVAFCNALSELEHLQPAYEVDGQRVELVEGADGYRLPTEAQWEYAALADQDLRFAGIDGTEGLCEFGNVRDAIFCRSSSQQDCPVTCRDGYFRLAPTASFKPNSWGLFDMTGNVSEWVWDWFAPYVPVDASDPSGPARGVLRCFRGGSWGSPPGGLRLRNRNATDPGDKNDTMGFRLARSP